MTNWITYLKCPTCHVPTGTACKSLSAHVVNGHPDGHEHTLEEPHKKRGLRSATFKGSEELARAIYAEDRRRAARADA